MGRIKDVEKRRARELAQEGKNTIGVGIPLRCAEQNCPARTQLGLFEPAPFGAALFRQSGWLSLTDEADGIVRFYCPEHKEGALIEQNLESS